MGSKSIISLQAAICFLAVAFLVLSPVSGSAQTLLERLVMPGDLIEGHAELESDCANCHISFTEAGESKLCIACHKEIDRDVAENRGFHGRRREVLEQECRYCHTDHKGRDEDIVQLDKETFDHTDTEFLLEDAHAILPCASCHLAQTKFRDAPTECADCHKEQEPHLGRLGDDCAACHKSTDWVDLRPFDHTKTDFTLEGPHRDVACTACHTGEIYADLPTDCVGCHRIQDIHAGSLGEKCQTCHVIERWTEVTFDHGSDTNFALIGAHNDLQCDSCHTKNAYEDVLSTTCFACHELTDAHEGQLGKDCATCHNSADWKEDVAFDHDITRFPLLGLHTLVPCEGCHLDKKFRTEQLSCVGCHQQDDVHAGNLTDQCETCHNPNGWEFWTFDHNIQTDFALTGLHEGITCKSCHTPARAASLQISEDCVACHAADDIHRGRFGKTCSLCHDTQSFNDPRLRK
jgi:hypothetical protein